MFFLNNTEQILQSAKDCKQYSKNHNCKGCPHLYGDYYAGEMKDTCFDSIMMDCSTNDMGKIVMQMYQLGYDNAIAEREKVIQPYESRINEGEFEWCCSNCNNTVKEGQIYCNTCGVKLMKKLI